MSFFAVCLIVLFAVSFAGASQQQMTTAQQQMMEQQMKYSTPTKAHDWLKNYVGKWDVEVKSWMQAGGEPVLSKASMMGELIFGGRFVKCDFQGQMMDTPFNGMQVIGYDLFQKKYVGFWIDSMSTAFYLTTGTLDMTGKVLTETGMWPNSMTGVSEKMRIVTTQLSDGKFRFEMFMTGPDGKAFKSMELTYSRKM